MMENLFDFDKVIILSRFLTLRSKGDILSESGNRLFYAEQIPGFHWRRVLDVYTDEDKTRKVLSIKEVLLGYDVVEENNILIGKIRIKINSLIKDYVVYDSSGRIIASMENEGGTPISKFWTRGLKTLLNRNFIVDSQRVGICLRKLSIKRKYFLDLSKDINKAIDRRLALSCGIILAI